MSLLNASHFRTNITPCTSTAAKDKDAKTTLPPSEKKEDFQHTLDVLRNIGLSQTHIEAYIHSFSDPQPLMEGQAEKAPQRQRGQANSSDIRPAYEATKHAAIEPLRKACASCASKAIGICASLPDRTLDIIYQTAKKTHFAPHSSLFNQGEAASRIFILTKGIVRLSKTLANGRRQVSGFAFPGELIGLAADPIHAISADAIGEVVACQISTRHFMQLAEAKPEILKLLNAAILSDLNTTQDQLASVGRHNAQERVATLLVNLRNRWHAIDHSSHYVALPMTREDIADYCGLSVESVSRTLADLARQKIIVIVPNGIRILNTAGITALTQGVASLV